MKGNEVWSIRPRGRRFGRNVVAREVVSHSGDDGRRHRLVQMRTPDETRF